MADRPALRVLFALAAPAQVFPGKTRADVRNRTPSLGYCRAPSSVSPALFFWLLTLALPCGDTETK